MNNDRFQDLIPDPPATEIDWSRVEAIFASYDFVDMARTPQNPIFHGEGDVLTHTRMVCEELLKMTRFQKLPQRQKAELFLAAVLHDIGKVKTTRMENGAWVSPHHASVGSRIVRELLWREFGLCGTRDAIAFRETVCALIRYHMLPVHLLDQEKPERSARQAAAVGELAPDFNLELLCLLAEADVKGRIAVDVEACAERVALAQLAAGEAGCLQEPCRFANGYTKHAYFSGRNVLPDLAIYDDTWGEIILLSGLPGTGKDTWIQQNAPSLPVISPDSIRRELNAAQTGDQTKVIRIAYERARELLRHRQPFVWNATNITRELRQEQVSLFERYGARVRIVYLETTWDAELQRNANRIEIVPEAAIEAMLRKTEPPTPDEAQIVEWICV